MPSILHDLVADDEIGIVVPAQVVASVRRQCLGSKLKANEKFSWKH